MTQGYAPQKTLSRSSVSLGNLSTKWHKLFFYPQATLTILDKLDIETENTTEEEVARKFGWEEDYLANDLTLWQRVKPRVWSLFDEPHSSTWAKVRRCNSFQAYFVCFAECILILLRYLMILENVIKGNWPV